MPRIRLIPVLSLAISVLLLVGTATAEEFVPGPYQTADGALVLNANGDYVEPYFAAKALLVASEAGLDVRQAANSFVRWMLPRQRRDGRIDRFCRKPGQDWKPCGRADADDSMMALWVQLLYRVAPSDGLPAEWQDSALRAQTYLFGLRRNRLGLYSVSRENHVALFMDNVEVYGALRETGAAESKLGETAQSQQITSRADDLAEHIQKMFWDKRHHLYRISTQKDGSWKFYPNAVAQTYAWAAGLPSGDVPPAQMWSAWRQAYGSAWLERKADPHPWGVLAVTALQFNDAATAGCWLSQSASLRYSKEWNVLEEAAFQAVSARIPSTAPNSCSDRMVSP